MKRSSHGLVKAVMAMGLIVLLLGTLSLIRQPEQPIPQLDTLELVVKDSHNEVCTLSECYPKMFEPTNEFKQIKPGQVLPPGCYVRMDMQTGEKVAKWADPNAHDTSQHLPVIHATPEKDALSLDEHNALGQLVHKLIEKSKAEILKILQKLEEVVHQMDWGFAFLDSAHGIPTLVRFISHDDPVVRKKAALVLGSAVQNNPKAQQRLLDAEVDVLSLLYIRLQVEKEIPVINRVVYALSSWIRSFKPGVVKFEGTKGMEHLARLYERIAEPAIREKLILFVWDLTNPDMWPSRGTFFNKHELELWCPFLDEAMTKDQPYSMSAFELSEQLLETDVECVTLREKRLANVKHFLAQQDD